ncbi:MAG: DUF4389 domain-containing protein [Porticoccaceae bacterium]
MSEDRQSNVTNPDLWIRLVYMLLFWLLSWLARLAIAVIAVIQFVLVLINGEGNGNLRRLGQGIAIWMQQNFQFLCFGSEEKPFPFQDWPQSPEEDGDDGENQRLDTAPPSSGAEETTEPASGSSPQSLEDHEGQDNDAKPSFGNTREP